MSVADFLLSPEVQQIIKLAYAQPSEQFTAAALAGSARIEAATVESTLHHLVASGILLCTLQGEDQAATHSANTAFVFYPELRRIALKSFAAAEPLRAMLRSKFRDSVLRAILLGEDEAAGAVDLLLVHGEKCPPREDLDAALQKLRKSGALRMHLRVQVMSDLRFDALHPHGLPEPGAGTAIAILSPGDTKARPSPRGSRLLHAAKRHLTRFALTR